MKPETKKDKALPPFVSSWSQLYWIVVGNLVLMICLFQLFSEYFR